MSTAEQEKLNEALELIEALARLTTPEEEFENLKGPDGIAEEDGMVFEDVDEMIAEFGDERLCDEYAAFMDFVRQAKKIVAP